MTPRAPAKAPATVGTGVGPSGAPKRRKRAPAQPAVYQPHECVILAIDPGEVSGWAVFIGGTVFMSFTAATAGERGAAVVIANERAHRYDLPLVVVAESWPLRWRPAGAPREAWGAWKVALELHGIPKRRIVRAPVGRWSAKILGGAALTTEQRRARSIARASAEVGKPIASHDEAAAICIGIYASRSPEVAKVLPKRRRPCA